MRKRIILLGDRGLLASVAALASRRDGADIPRRASPLPRWGVGAFSGIPEVVFRTLEDGWPDLVGSFDDVLHMYCVARSTTRNITHDLQKDTE